MLGDVSEVLRLVASVSEMKIAVSIFVHLSQYSVLEYDYRTKQLTPFNACLVISRQLA